MQRVRDIFKEQAKEQEASTTKGTESGEMDYISDETIEREGMEIDRLIKRSRESLTPPLRDEKRKKDGSGSTQSSRPLIPAGKPQQQPQPPSKGAEGGAVPKKQWSREREGEGGGVPYLEPGPLPRHPSHHNQTGISPGRWESLYMLRNHCNSTFRAKTHLIGRNYAKQSSKEM